MNTKHTFLTLAIGLVAGFGLGFAVPVLSQATSRPSNFVRETVAIDASWVNRVTVLEDRKRNRVCYITGTAGGRDHGISCVILDQNNPR